MCGWLRGRASRARTLSGRGRIEARVAQALLASCSGLKGNGATKHEWSNVDLVRGFFDKCSQFCLLFGQYLHKRSPLRLVLFGFQFLAKVFDVEIGTGPFHAITPVTSIGEWYLWSTQEIFCGSICPRRSFDWGQCLCTAITPSCSNFLRQPSLWIDLRWAIVLE